MVGAPSTDAWNNFVLQSDPAAYDNGSDKRSAAIAALYMALANNGGINSFLTASCDLDASEVLEALVTVGALKAAKEFGYVLRRLSTAIPRSSQAARSLLIQRRWQTSLDDYDVLTAEAHQDLLRALRLHVEHYEAFYAALSARK